MSRPEFDTLYEQLSDLLSVFAIQSVTKCDRYSDETSVYNNTLSRGCYQTTPTQAETNILLHSKHLPNSEHRSPETTEQLSSKVDSSSYGLGMPNQSEENDVNTSSLSSGSEKPVGKSDHTPPTRSILILFSNPHLIFYKFLSIHCHFHSY